MPSATGTAFPGQLGWERSVHIMEQLDNPQNEVPAFHIAGTSGKGSVVTLLAAAIRGAGFSVGHMLSPHVVDIRERIQVNGEMIPEEDFVIALNAVLPVIEQTEQTHFGKPTFFDVITAMGFWYFASQQLDYSVIETGLGGLLDGTNVITRADKVPVFTPIGYDHMHVLGETLAAIAGQKAAIMKNARVGFSCTQVEEAKEVFDDVAASVGVDLRYIERGRNFETGDVLTWWGDNDVPQGGISEGDNLNRSRRGMNCEIGLHGVYQQENAALALSALQYVLYRDGRTVDWDGIADALTRVRFRGRFEEVSIGGVEVVLDGAHNPQKMEAFVGAYRSRYPGIKVPVIVSLKQGKPIADTLKPLVVVADRFVIVPFTNSTNDILHRSYEANEIADVLAGLTDAPITTLSGIDAIPEYLQNCGFYRAIITGSLYLLAEVFGRQKM